jgi:Arc/MetJ family transcription regulator
MRTNIVLDDELIHEAMKVSGIRTRKDVVHRALQLLVETESAAQRRARYDLNMEDVQRRTQHLKLRESAHDMIRADRDHR